ncbi:HslU--HslV peptidase ATPase subunit [Helicobacter suis]|uniref:ATP-dependent protease, ATP-binding subunit n=2 Tax=Helicobacter suis TaxID=104628 RepID=E7G4L3_9HELI|nr:HslU--HslV peptidase ATPase subunit [Helicobacter suis]EFX41706.1 ATP-dependent protease, ATP-binding subunit [Helicobacter suis HS5]EFX43288.1 ATP-dependent protease ATP-binding subunit [Helicobacter suis HS1]BCD45047.1 ATP-dependent protease ATP-binding subunit HslU [Helicobacter suis]BCD46880.1 ATP-dependent protease ATP-binding subunit HslU [Helicobacter suis]BCD48638.1 ATP-dependent protease ATP-binding subunit HslU [Helicobacter suis]
MVGHAKLNLTPQEIVRYLDDYIIGQQDAKKMIAIALRNRWRRLQLSKELQEEVMPKNILMIGSTGVGKTEIARRMAKMMGLPFIKVEASKYTEVGFVGRDVESMVRDLVVASIHLVENEEKEKNQAKIEDLIIERITKKLLPPLPSGVGKDKQQEYALNFEKTKQKVRSHVLDDQKIQIELDKRGVEGDFNMPPEIIKVQESLTKILNKGGEKVSKEMTIKEAKEALRHDVSQAILDMEQVQREGVQRAAQCGVIFIDEIDKIAVGSKEGRTQDPSKEGVQRDLLPIVEGSTIQTKYGPIATDHILFIAAGAFHLSKPSDLIPELQGRFPLRVELESLSEEIMYEILTRPKSSLIKQYQALLEVENVDLAFEPEALRELARFSYLANQKTEDIGARRLHTTLEKVLEDISFNATAYAGQKVVVSKKDVSQTLQDLVEDVDLARFIL